MASKFHGKHKFEKTLLDSYITYAVPRIYAAFCLVLYDKYQWEPEQIQEAIAASDELWDRSSKEGWDIRENCLECTGINVIHFKQTGQITYEG